MALLQTLAQLMTFDNSFIVEMVIVVILAIIVLFSFKFVFDMGRKILKFGFVIIANSILGLAAVFLLDYFFNVNIPIKFYTILPVALFGLPSVATLLILRLFGVTLG